MPSFFKHTAFGGALLIVAGLVFSPALQSIGCALIFLYPFLNGQSGQIIKVMRQNKSSLWLVAYYFLIIVSILYTSNYEAFWKQNIILKLPFLLLPVGFCCGAGFDKKKLQYLLYFFIFIVWIMATASFINYILNFDEINAQIIHSKPIPIVSGISHIYFGIMLAFACALSFYFSWMEKSPKNALNWLMRIIFFSFLIYLHSITARTGMLAFYASVFVCVIWFMWQARRFLIGFSILSGMGLLFAASLYLVPSLNNRLVNTQEDINHFTKGKELNHYSISMRIESLKTAWKVYKKAPLFGVGPADIIPEMQAQYEADNSPLILENRKLPHNQFLQTLTTMGIPGLAILFAFFAYPFLRRKTYFSAHPRQILFFAFLVICFFSFQVESVLERQIGVTFFALFYVLLSSPNIAIHED